MKKILLSTTALIAMTAMAAAADLPARTLAPAPIPVAAPVFTWSGFYAGINGGYVWNETNIRLRGTTGLAAAALPGRVDLDDDGFTIGGHVGGNVQFGVFVAGLEADIAYTHLDRSRSIAVPGLGGGTVTANGGLDY